MDEPQEMTQRISEKIDHLSIQLEKAKLLDYVELNLNKRKLLWNNFIGGLARGFGMAVGFTLLGGLIIYLLRYLVLLNLPVIGSFISELVRIVQNNL